jgi:hypothetical protein
MTRGWNLTAVAILMLTGCGTAGEETATAETEPVATASEAETLTCTPSERMALEGRASPYDSTLFTIAGEEAKLCYGRPSVRGRQIFGDLVPYDTLWRTGANEPTIIHLPVDATVAGIPLEAGSYSIYTVPGREEWQVVVNSSTEQWGHESQYVDEVRAQEVARATVPATSTEAPVETLNIHAEVADPGVDLVLEWESTRVRIPVRPS